MVKQIIKMKGIIFTIASYLVLIPIVDDKSEISDLFDKQLESNKSQILIEANIENTMLNSIKIDDFHIKETRKDLRISQKTIDVLTASRKKYKLLSNRT
jgi:hypothetical protein